jgi:hypothetical protein
VSENLRRVLLSGLLGMLFESRVTQLLLSLLVSYLSLRSHITFKPFKNPSDNWVAIVAQAVTVFNTLFLLWLGMGAERKSQAVGQTFPLVITVFNISLVGFVGGLTLFDFSSRASTATAPARQRFRQRVTAYVSGLRTPVNWNWTTMRSRWSLARGLTRRATVIPDAGVQDPALGFGGHGDENPGGQGLNPLFSPTARPRRQRHVGSLAVVRQSRTLGLHRTTGLERSQGPLRVSHKGTSTPEAALELVSQRERPEGASRADEGPQRLGGSSGNTLGGGRRSGVIAGTLTRVSVLIGPAAPKRWNVVSETEQLDLDALGPAHQVSNPLFAHALTPEAEVAVTLDDAFAGSSRPAQGSGALGPGLPTSNPLFAHVATGEAEVAVTLDDAYAGSVPPLGQAASNPMLDGPASVQ